MSVLFLSLGLVIGFFGPEIYYRLKNAILIRKLTKTVLPSTIDEKRMCKGPHSWMPTPTITAQGQGTADVCRLCGFISGTDKMASLEMLDRIEENNRIRETEEKLFNSFSAQEDEEIKAFFSEELKTGISFDKLLKLHSAGMTFHERFFIYKASRAGELEKEINRGNA